MQRGGTSEPPRVASSSLRGQRHLSFAHTWVPWGSHSPHSGSNVGLHQMQSVIEENDKDDVSEDEDNSQRRQAFIVKLRKLLKAVFPDWSPFLWLILPFAVCGLIYVLNFGKIAPGAEYPLVVDNPAIPDMEYSVLSMPPLQVGSIGVRQLHNEGCLILLYWSLCSVALWFVFMLLRVMVMVIIMNLLPYETQALTAFITPVDPEVVYVIWSILVYGIWREMLIERDSFVLPIQGSKAREALYSSRFFTNLSIRHELMQHCNQLWIGLIILTVRRLLLSVITFLFEIGFMRTMNSQLVAYLTKYAILRRLNTRWAASPETKKSQLADEVLNSEDLIGFSVHSPAALPNSRTAKLAVFRFRTVLSQKGHKREYFGSGMPKQLTNAFIKRTVTSSLHNWILIHYVLQYPPAFFLWGHRIELLSKASTETVAEHFFSGLMEISQAHFPSANIIEAEVADVGNQPEVVAEPVQEQTSPEDKRMPKLAMNVQVKEAGPSPTTGPLQSQGHVQVDLNGPEGSVTIRPSPDTATRTQGVSFKTEEAQQRTWREDDAELLPVDIYSRASSDELTSLPSIPSNSIEALLCLSLLGQCPSDSIDQFLLSRSPETPALSRCTSLQGGNQEESNEPEPIIQIKEEPQAQAHGPTSSLFATSLPQPPWTRALRGSRDSAHGGFGREQRTQDSFLTGMPGGAKVSEQVFGQELLEVFLKPNEATEFMHQVDLGGYGKINSKMLKRAFFSMYRLRKAFIKAVKNQVSICNTVQKMISLILWVVAVVGLLLLLGLNFNTVIFSGAATLSALTVALSNLYKEFISAVIFIAISNPYNVGDRVRVGDGIPLYVKRIRTYTTEFLDIYGKQVLHSNDALWKCVVINESRAKNASHNFIVRVQIETQMVQLRILEKAIKRAMDSQPMDYVKDSFLIFISNFEPGKWLEVSIWVTTVENWGNITKTLRLRTDIFLVIQSVCYELDITYHEPHLPVQIDQAALGELIHSARSETRPDNNNSSSVGGQGRESQAPPAATDGPRRRSNGSAGQRASA